MVILNLGCGYIEKDVVIWSKNPYQISGISVTPHPSHIPIRIESNDHCAYWPSCLHAYPILAIIHISHHAHQPSCQSTIMTPNPLILILSYHAYQPSYLSAIIPISFIAITCHLSAINHIVFQPSYLSPPLPSASQILAISQMSIS